MNRPIIRRSLLAIGSALAALALGSVSVAAQTWPTRPIRILVGFAPGGAVDIIARALGENLAGQLGQPVIVENRPGAGSNIAAGEASRSAPDGYTLLLGTNGVAVNMTLFARPGFDVADLTPISKVGEIAAIFAANPAFPASDIKGLVQAAKAKPGELIYGSPGNGSSPHLAAELFRRMADIRITHISYKGGAPAITDTIGNHIPLVAVNALEALPQVQAGSLKALAVTSEARLPMLPNVPTVAESGFPGYSSATWYAVFGPGKMPAEIVTRLNAAIAKALTDPRFREKVESVGGQVAGSSPESLRDFVSAERAKWGQVIRESGIKAD